MTRIDSIGVSKFIRGSSVALAGFVLWIGVGCGADGRGGGESSVTGPPSLAGVVDLDGHSVDPFAHTTNCAEVFVFVASDCPISNRYAPELRRLADTLQPKGVRFRLVYPNVDDSPTVIRKHVADYNLPTAVMRDPEHSLVRRAKVRVTPEAAIFLPDGTLIYHGRIDDRYVDFGQARPEPTQRDLQQVLTDILAGKPVAESSTRAIGCSIPNR